MKKAATVELLFIEGDSLTIPFECIEKAKNFYQKVRKRPDIETAVFRDLTIEHAVRH